MAQSDIDYNRRRNNQETVKRLQGRLDAIPGNLNYERSQMRSSGSNSCDRDRRLKSIGNLEKEQATLRSALQSYRGRC